MGSEVGSAPGAATLTIGDLAARSGLSASTLRMWETRHGFPEPQRLESGHRRYTETDVALVRDVAARRDAGVRLDAAVAAVRAGRASLGHVGDDARDAARPAAPSVFAELRRRHPHLEAHRLRKSTLLAMSYAIEDEFCARAQSAHVFGAFQEERYFESARHRWDDVARVSESSFVFAAFADADSADLPARLHRVKLDPDAPMAREWAVVCDAENLPVTLTAWELPGQQGVADGERRFESVWTTDADAVRDAARVCAGLAVDAGVGPAAAAAAALAGPAVGRSDPAAVAGLFSRMIDYLDRGHVSRV